MNPTRAKFQTTAANCRRRVCALVKALPEGRAVPTGEGRLSLEACGQRFGWLLEDHHGDGRIALNLKAPKGAGQRLAGYAPERFHVPNHLGRHGWIGVWLDAPEPDWAEIQELIENAGLLAPSFPRAQDPLTTINSTSP
jgi:hypothetical protein